MGNAYADGVRNSGLLQYDLPPAAPNPTSCTTLASPPKLEPAHLVKSWQTTDGGHKISFVLNSGIKSQAGNVLSTADVKWSIDREKAIDPVGQLLMYTLGGFNKIDPITVTGPLSFTLNVTTPTTITDLELTELWQEVYDAKTVQANATKADPWGKKYLADHVADFGPLKLTSFTPSQSVSYGPNPNYTGPKGNISNITVKIVTDASTRQEVLQTGGAQAADALSYDQYSALNGKVGVVSCASAYRDFLGLETKSGPLANEGVRQAISMAINRAQLVQAAYHGLAKSATSGVSSVFGPTTGTSNFVFDASKAKQMLASAGYPSGFPITLAIAPSSMGAYTTTLAEFLKQQLAAVGITVTIQTVPTASQFKTDLSKGAYQAFLDTESPDFNDPGYAYELTNGCQGLQSFAGWCDKADDALAQRIQATTQGGAARTALINQLSTAINTQMPVVYLTEVPSLSARETCITDMQQAFPTYNDFAPFANSSC